MLGGNVILGFVGALIAVSTAAGQLQFSGVFEETVSPDGRYALAWGVDGKAMNWEGGEFEGIDFSQDFENYIVDLKAKRILRKTGTTHFPSENHGMLDVVWWPDSRQVLVMHQSKWRTAAIRHFETAEEGGLFGDEAGDHLDRLTGYVRGYVAGVKPAYLFDDRFFVTNFGAALPFGPDHCIVKFSADHGKFTGPAIDGFLVVRLGGGAWGSPCSLVAAIDKNDRADGQWSGARMFSLQSMLDDAGVGENDAVQAAWMEYITASRGFYQSLAAVPEKGALLDAAGLGGAIEVRMRQVNEEEAWTLETLLLPEDADAQLNERYGMLKGMLSGEQGSLLTAAQRRWIGFRDANGNAAQDTAARADELKRVIEILEWKLPN